MSRLKTRKRKRKIDYFIGIDEVGRGALAGPVVVAALALPQKSKIKFQKSKAQFRIKNFKTPLRDSKRLTLKQREGWFHSIKRQKIPYVISNVSPKIIDKINVSNAANLAAAKAFKKLIARYSLNSKFCKVFLDGGLYLLNSPNSKFQIPNSRTIIRGDEKIPAIALASIVAKVNRDRYMKKLHKKYPRYDFINNVGYGTKRHIKAIKKFSYSPIHRKSFKIH